MDIERKLVSVWVLMLLTTFLLSACGGGESSSDSTEANSPAIDTVSPSLLSISPENNAIDIEPDTIISGSFDEDILNTSISEETFRLTDENGRVPGLVEFDGESNVMSFTPDQPLDLMTEYKAEITTGIVDLYGNSLLSNKRWNFTTRDGVWGEANVVENDFPERPYNHKLFFDDNGGGLLVWKQADDIEDKLWAKQFSEQNGWLDKKEIATAELGSMKTYQVANNNNGDAFVTWRQKNDSVDNLLCRHYSVEGEWLESEEIVSLTDEAIGSWDTVLADDGSALLLVEYKGESTSTLWSYQFTAEGSLLGSDKTQLDLAEDIGSIQLSLNADNSVSALWGLSESSGRNIAHNKFDNETGWSEKKTIDLTEERDTYGSKLAFSQQGHAIAVWYEFVGIDNTLFSSYFDSENGWQEPVVIHSDADDNVNFENINVVMNDEGIAQAVWIQHDYTTRDVWSARFTPQDGWLRPQSISVDGSYAKPPLVSIDPNGNTLVSWVQADKLWSKRFTSSLGWRNTSSIQSSESVPYNVDVKMDAEGNALAVWTEVTDEVSKVVGNRFTINDHWGDASIIETDNINPRNFLSLVLNRNGHALVRGIHLEAGTENYDLWSMRFD